MSPSEPPKNDTTAAVIPAAGLGKRFGGVQGKQFVELDGEPLLAMTLRPFQLSSRIHALFVVVPGDQVTHCRKQVVAPFSLDKVLEVVPGGERRQDSVRLGLEATGGTYTRILVHDGVRPLVDGELIERVIRVSENHRCVVPGLPATETVKEVDEKENVVKTCDRTRIRLIQTPQAFRYEDIARAHARALAEGWEEVTDDAALVERLGVPVTVVQGSERNIKITRPEDLKRLRMFLANGA